MSYIDDIASISAARHCRCETVTASMDSVDFLRPIGQQDSVCLESYVTWVGTSSMEVFVKVIKEHLMTGERELAATSFLTFVATSVSPHGHVPGWMTKGILDKDTYYYRGVYLDAVRALEVISGFDEVDETRIAVIGGSQGGGLSIAAAALSDIPRAVAADYPYLSNFERAIDVALDEPYLEINSFFRKNGSPETEKAAMNTLAYFDIMNLADRVKVPVLMSPAD